MNGTDEGWEEDEDGFGLIGLEILSTFGVAMVWY